MKSNEISPVADDDTLTAAIAFGWRPVTLDELDQSVHLMTPQQVETTVIDLQTRYPVDLPEWITPDMTEGEVEAILAVCASFGCATDNWEVGVVRSMWRRGLTTGWNHPGSIMGVVERLESLGLAIRVYKDTRGARRWALLGFESLLSSRDDQQGGRT